MASDTPREAAMTIDDAIALLNDGEPRRPVSQLAHQRAVLGNLIRSSQPDLSDWLKDGETVRERLERERNDILTLMNELAREKLKCEAAEAQLHRAQQRLDEQAAELEKAKVDPAGALPNTTNKAVTDAAEASGLAGTQQDQQDGRVEWQIVDELWKAHLLRVATERKIESLFAALLHLSQQLAEASAALDELAAPDPGKPLAQRIRDEFADFQMVIDHCSQAYYHMTDGRISKPNTLPSVVCTMADDLESERQQEAVREALSLHGESDE